jgi:hypothetical protein
LALVAALFAAFGCGRQSAPPADAPSSPGQVRSFTGTWSTTGSRQTMQLEAGHRATIFRYTGSLLLSGPQRLKTGFQADVLGFSDTRSGMQGRCVWTDEGGDKVFSELRAEANNTPDTPIEGRILGGTGRFAGASGAYTFRWQRLIDNEDGQVSGRVVGLTGWARLGSPDESPATAGGHQ